MKTKRILFLFIVCFVVLSTNIQAQENTAPSPGENRIQNFYFNKPNSGNLKAPFIFSSPIVQLESSAELLQFHFDLVKATDQNRYYQSSLDKMICITSNKPINDNLNAMPIYKIQDLSKMPNAFPIPDMITSK